MNEIIPDHMVPACQNFFDGHRIQAEKDLLHGAVQTAGLRSVSETNLKQRPFTTGPVI